MHRILIAVTLLAVFVSCDESSNKKKTTNKTKTSSEHSNTEIAEKPATVYTQESSPVWVANQIFEAAKTGNYAILSTLCDPSGELDEKAVMLCDVINSTESEQVRFADFFKPGEIYGDPVISGNKARIQLKLGPEKYANETIILIKRDGKWYLSSFL